MKGQECKMLKKISLLIIAVLVLPLMLLACKNDADNEVTDTVFYKVTFNSNGGSTVKEQNVPAGAKVALPETPEYTNYVFIEWRYNGNAWDFENDTVKGDMELKAEWRSADALFNFAKIGNTESVEITGFNDSFSPLPKTVMLPETIKGNPVVGVAEGAFKDTPSEDVSEFILPKPIVSVGKSAFDGCENIAITVRGELIDIGPRSFALCNGLLAVSLGEGLEEIGAEAFFESGLKSLYLPKSIKTIDEDAFKNCAQLKVAVVYPMTGDGDTVIGNSAFRGCNALKTVFFGGTDEELDALLARTADGNEAFCEAKLSLYSETEPTEEGSFWHIVNGEPREW